ncbi:LysR substrate-binding domain-containing protein [Paraburkholderia silviterrae]|nr:LysR substrate-binding domain-containing protein [Paraburkholderia silviterrae]
MTTRRKLPPLNAVKAFEAAARLGGFTAAGEELFVSPGAISRHVANLESFLGITLFKRGHNEVRLTQEGSEYLAKVAGALSAIEDASRRASAPSGTQSLHIHALPTFAEFWLLPRLGAFRMAHPDARIQLTTSMEETDWDTDSADISVYASEGGWNERGIHLFDTTISPVCGPQWRDAADRDMRISPNELVDWPLLSSVNKAADWLRWFHACELQPDSARPQYLFGTSSMAYKAAMNGLGAVCAELAFVGQACADGQLLRLSTVIAPGSSYFVEARPGKKESDLSRAFKEWIVDQAGS